MQVYEGIWRKRYFVPSWIIQCLVSGFFFVAAILVIWAATRINSVYRDISDDNSDLLDDTTKKALIGVGTFMLVLSLFTIISDVVESALFHRRRLAPKTVVILSTVRALGWLVYLIVGAIATARAVSGLLDVILGILMVVTALVQLYYGAKFFHKERKGQLFQPANKAGGTGYGMDNFAPVPNNNHHNTAQYA
ncbi:hypothetical protein PG995_012914 [Apiospora arundinis]